MSFCFIIYGWGFSLQINYFDVIWCGRTLFGYAWMKHGEWWSGERYQYADGRFSWTVTRKGRNRTFAFQRLIRG